MSLPALDKTYVFGAASPFVNQQILALGTMLATNRRTLRAIKDSFLGLGFTVVKSSDSVASDATDRWAADANLVWDIEGNAHSWILLQGNGFQVLLDLDHVAVNGDKASVYLSVTGFTGGTNTARPTAADAFDLALTPFLWGGLTGGDANVRLHVWGANDRTVTHVALFSAGVMLGFWTIQVARNAVSTGWPGMVFGYVGAGSTALTTLLRGGGLAWINGALASVAFTGEAVFSGAPPYSPLHTTATGPDDQSGEFPLSPVGLFGITAGATGRKGACHDLYWGLSVNANGSTYPGDATKQFVQFGDWIFPWNGTTALTT